MCNVIFRNHVDEVGGAPMRWSGCINHVNGAGPKTHLETMFLNCLFFSKSDISQCMN